MRRESAFALRGQIGATAVGDFSRHADGFAQRRMRMDGLADVRRVGAHFDREADLADQIAGMRADNGAADDALRFLVEQQLGHPFVAPVGDCASGSGPGEYRLVEGNAFFLGLDFGQTGPGDFWVGVGHGWDLQGIEAGFLTGCDFRCDVAFMDRLVGKHGLTNDVADGKNVRHIGAHLVVGGDEALLGYGDAGFVCADLVAVRAAADGDQHQVVALGIRRCFFTFEFDPDTVFFRFCRDRFGLEHDVVETMGVHFLPYLDEIAIRALHQAVLHFDHIDPRTQGGIDRRHFKADDAAANDEHLFGYGGEFQRTGGVDHARVIRHEGQFYRLAAGRDDALLELHHLLFAGDVLAFAGSELDFNVLWIQEASRSAHDLDLATLGHAGEAAGEFAHHLFFVRAQLVDVELRLAIGHTKIGKMADFVHHARNVQQRFRRNAADIQAHAAEGRVTFDDDRLEPEICGAE